MQRIINGESVQQHELEALDRERVEIVKKAEKQCRKLRTGMVPYSPENVQKHCKLYYLWNLVTENVKKKSKYEVDQKADKSVQHSFPDKDEIGRCKGTKEQGDKRVYKSKAKRKIKKGTIHRTFSRDLQKKETIKQHHKFGH